MLTNDPGALTMRMLKERVVQYTEAWMLDHPSVADSSDDAFQRFMRATANAEVPTGYDVMLEVLASDSGLWTDEDEIGNNTMRAIFHTVVEGALMDEMIEAFEMVQDDDRLKTFKQIRAEEDGPFGEDDDSDDEGAEGGDA